VSVARASTGYLCFAVLAAAIMLEALGLISPAALDHVFLLPAAWTVYRLVRRPGQGTARPLAAGLGAAIFLVLLQLGLPFLRYTPYLAIIPANLVLAHLFARGLLPGREPVLLRLIALMGLCPAEDPRFRRFVAWQCFLWSLLTLATAAVSTLAMVWAAERADLAAALGWLVGVQVFWFIATHLYAGLRYDRPETCLATLRAMSQPGLWSKLRVR